MGNLIVFVTSAAKSTRSARPAPNPIFDPEGEPDTPLFALPRYQPDSTRFLALRIGFNPIQPYPTRQPKIISFSFYCVVFVFPQISEVKSKVQGRRKVGAGGALAPPDIWQIS